MLGRVSLGCAVLLLLCSCRKDEAAPRIDSVWINMVSRPVEQVECAYPGQTLCLRGEHLGSLSHVIVNGTDINLNTLFVYESETAITFTLPADVNTDGDYIRVVTGWGMCDYPFVVRPAAEQPHISAFSATTLIPDRTLTISGAHLDGATQVWLPIAFGGSVQCVPGDCPEDGSSVSVVIPEDAAFATGICGIVMEKYDASRGFRYTEKVYSAKTDFRN